MTSEDQRRLHLPLRLLGQMNGILPQTSREIGGRTSLPSERMWYSGGQKPAPGCLSCRNGGNQRIRNMQRGTLTGGDKTRLEPYPGSVIFGVSMF